MAKNIFRGQTFCVSGKFSRSQGEMRSLIEEHGGALADTPNKKCTFLVSDSIGSAKTMKAIKDGIDIVTEEWVEKSIAAKKLLTDKKLFLSGGGGDAAPAAAASDDEEDEDEDMTPAKGKGKKAAPKAAAASKAAPASKASGGAVFEGHTFCVSGNFSKSQSEVKELLIKNGGHVAATANRSCSYLVADGIGSSKTQKAIKDGIAIVTEAWVDDSITAGKLLTDKKYFLSGGADAAAAADDDDEDDAKPTKKAPAKRKRGASDDSNPNDPVDPIDAAGTTPAAADTMGKRARKSTTSGAAATAAADAVPETKSAPNMKTVVLKGGKGSAPVDEKCPKHASVHVYQEGSNVYDAMLNQTNIGNNNNKYYVIQLLESDAGKTYYVWTRWGRVGKDGQNALQPCGSLEAAKAAFGSKFSEKTRNQWADRANFVAYSGKYTLLERDYSADDAEPEDGADGSAAADVPESKLDKRVQDLIKLICDLNMMKQQMIEVGYDAQKLPLGKLSKEHVRKGYEVLQQIALALDNDKRPSLELSNQFYSLIPHATVGMRPPPAINTKQLLKEKIAMVESLADIELATKLLRQSSTGSDAGVNPIDSSYEKLQCAFTPVEHSDIQFQMVTDYVKNTHGHTHKTYSLEVLDVFNLDRVGETAKFDNAGFDKVGNKQLLWHGSRLTNFVGIISQGLRIAPPEAPVTGYMFGKGVYFGQQHTVFASMEEEKFKYAF